MALLVVDTNVPVVANGGTEQPGAQCINVCAGRLYRMIQDRDRLALDAGRLILQEYMRNLHSHPPSAPGSLFLKWVLTNWTNADRVELIGLTPQGDSFEEFPASADLTGFHNDDQKFVAVAMKHPDRPPILNATDSDWWDYRKALERHGVVVEFLCPDIFAVK